MARLTFQCQQCLSRRQLYLTTDPSPSPCGFPLINVPTTQRTVLRKLKVTFKVITSTTLYLQPLLRMVLQSVIVQVIVYSKVWLCSAGDNVYSKDDNALKFAEGGETDWHNLSAHDIFPICSHVLCLHWKNIHKSTCWRSCCSLSCGKLHFFGLHSLHFLDFRLLNLT